MRIAFLGSPDFAVPSLRALHAAGHEIAAVYSQPPRPAGRGQAVRPCPVHAQAERLGLMVRTPARLRGDPDTARSFAALDLDAAVVVAYGLILPMEMLQAPRRGCLNIHASLLPRWRGASPIQAAILQGDTESGITIMRMDAGLDTGPMLLRAALSLGPRCTAAGLHDRLAELGASMVLAALRDDPRETPQPTEGVTYAPRLTRADGRLDWQLPAEVNDRRVRALNPWPGTWTLRDGEMLKILEAEMVPGDGPPGTVLDERLTVACGQGALRLSRVQRPGRAAMGADEYLRGVKLPPGSVLGA